VILKVYDSRHVKTIASGVARCCRATGRDPAGVTLVAVAKTFPAYMVREAVPGGCC